MKHEDQHVKFKTYIAILTLITCLSVCVKYPALPLILTSISCLFVCLRQLLPANSNPNTWNSPVQFLSTKWALFLSFNQFRKFLYYLIQAHFSLSSIYHSFKYWGVREPFSRNWGHRYNPLNPATTTNGLEYFQFSKGLNDSRVNCRFILNPLIFMPILPVCLNWKLQLI